MKTETLITVSICTNYCLKLCKTLMGQGTISFIIHVCTLNNGFVVIDCIIYNIYIQSILSINIDKNQPTGLLLYVITINSNVNCQFLYLGLNKDYQGISR